MSELNDKDSIITNESEITDEQSTGQIIAKTAWYTFIIVGTLVALIVAITALAAPLSAMRTYNKLGMTNRALESATRYIDDRLNKQNVEHSYNIYTLGMADGSFTDNDFIEATRTAIYLSDKMMASASNKSKQLGYAAMLERFTREYLSIFGIQAVNDAKSQTDVQSVTYTLQPYVSNYARTLRILNYRARVILGESDKLIYLDTVNASGSVITDIVIDTLTASNSIFGIEFPTGNANRDLDAANRFIQFAAQLNEYVVYELNRLNINESMSDGDIHTAINSAISKGEITSSSKYFSLLINRDRGFSGIYNNIVGLRAGGSNTDFDDFRFVRYTDYIVESMPVGGVMERLNQLYGIHISALLSRNMQKVLTALSALAANTELNLFTNADYQSIINEQTLFKVYNGDGDLINSDGRWNAYQVYNFAINLDGSGTYLSDVYRQRFDEYLAFIGTL